MKKHLLRVCDYIILIIAVIAYACVSFGFQLLFGFSPVLASTAADIIVLCFCGSMYFGFRKKGIFKEKPTEDKDFLLKYILFFIFLSFGILIVFSWINNTFADPTMVHRENSINKGSIYLYIATSILIVPAAEEFLMRLFLYNFLKIRSSWMVSMIVTSIIFALMHGTISHLIIGTIFAVFMTLAYESTGKWYISIIGHTVYNFMAVTISDMTSFLGSVTPIVVITMLVLFVLMIQQTVSVLEHQKK